MFQRSEAPIRLNGTAPAQAFFAPVVHEGDDRLHVAHVDEHSRCIHVATYPAVPNVDHLPVGEILRDAAQLGSTGLVIAHAEAPSNSTDRRREWPATRHLAEAADLIRVTLLDHLIFHGRDCTSLRRIGAL